MYRAMNKKEKNRKTVMLLNRAIKYFKSHMWCSFALAIATSTLLLLMIIMVYMKKQYYAYLVDTAYATEKALVDSVNKNMDRQLENYINIGASLAVSEHLPEDIGEFLNDEKDATAYKKIKNSFKTAGEASTYIVGIAAADPNGIIYQYDKNEMVGNGKVIWEEEEDENIKSIFNEIKTMGEDGKIPRYKVITQPAIHPNVSKEGIIHIAYPLRKGYNYRNVECILIVSYYIWPFESLLIQLNYNQEKYIQGYIEGDNGKILLHTGGREYVGGKANTYENDSNLTDISQKIDDYNWKLHAVIDKTMIRKKVDDAYNKMFLLYFAAIVFILCTLFLTTKRILSPVKIISASISQVKGGAEKEQIPILGTNEIWQLAHEYNEMLQAIRKAEQEVKEQHDQVMESLKMQQRAEREALESQINAHFICNTLNAINYEAIDSGNYKVSILLKKLSNILRYTFDQKHQNVYIFQEITWVEQYLFLQKERMDQEFDYEISFDSDYDNWPCGKLMLQPFVENSILHGFNGRDGGGFVKIKGEGYKEFLKISIEDNGCGMPYEQRKIIREILQNPMAAKKQSIGIGISNVITRMKMYYGEEFMASLETEEGKGTCFTFILPMPQKNRTEEKDKEIKYENFNSRG